MTTTAPAPSLDFSIKAEQVNELTKAIIKEELEANDAIAALKPEEQTYENVIPRLIHLENTLAGTQSKYKIKILWI